MRGGCCEIMSSSLQHISNRLGGFLDDSYFHQQDIQQIQCREQQLLGSMMFYPPSSGTTTHGVKEVDYSSLKRDVVDFRELVGVCEVDAYHRTREGDFFQCGGELGSIVLGVTANSWAIRDELTIGGAQPQNSPKPELLIKPYETSVHLLSQLVSRDNGPLSSLSSECKIVEPPSTLELASRPRLNSRAAISNYELTQNSMASDATEEFFPGEDTSAQLLHSKEEDTSERKPSTTSTNEWLQQTTQLWIDSFMDDLAVTTAQSSIPGLEERDEAHADTPTSTLSTFCNKMAGIDDHELSEDELGATGDGAWVHPEDFQTLQRTFSVDETPNRETMGHELVDLLLACVEAVSTESISHINPLFAQLGETASPNGSSMQRMAAYFTEGLAIRCSRLWPHIYHPLPYNLELSEEDSLCAFHALNQVTPYIKFAHFTANDIILQAFEGCDRVHIIDFDIRQGLQWPALFQSLAARPEGPPSHVRLTGIGEYKEDVQDTGDRLAEFAEALDLPFEFHAVIDKLEDVRLWMLHVKENETVATNYVFQLHRILNDAENGIKDMLHLILSTKPKVVAVVEQEASHNGMFFEGRHPRFLESLQYYAAIFDSVDANMSPASRSRTKVEQFFANEIRNIIACEGQQRSERHERIETWRQHMERGGFRSAPLTKRARSQAQLLLAMFTCKSYTLVDDEDALTLGWRNRPLFTASAWTPKVGS